MYFFQVYRDQECTVFSFPCPPTLPSAVPLCPSGPLRTFSRSVKVNSTTVQVQSKQHHCCGAFSVIRSSLHDLCMIGSPQNWPNKTYLQRHWAQQGSCKVSMIIRFDTGRDVIPFISLSIAIMLMCLSKCQWIFHHCLCTSNQSILPELCNSGFLRRNIVLVVFRNTKTVVFDLLPTADQRWHWDSTMWIDLFNEYMNST